MQLSTSIRKIHNRFILKIFSKSKSIRLKLKYFIQSNQLFLIDEFKTLKENEGMLQKIHKIQLAVVIKYEIKKNEYGDKILIIKLMKTGSILDTKLNDLGGQLQSLFHGKLLESNNEIGYVEYKILYKESTETEICDLSKDIYYDPTGIIKLSKRHDWQYKSKPHLLISGNSGSGKSYLLFSIIYKMIAETEKEHIFICDGKFDELEKISSEKFKLPMVANNVNDIKSFIEHVEESMELRYKSKSKDNDAVFLVIDEFAALNLVIDKKQWQEMNRRIKNIILKGRAANVHVLIAMQRASADSIDLSIRDNTAVKIGLGNLSVENFKMTFGENRNENEILKREIGQGYILIDGKNISLFDSPTIKI